MSTATLVAKQAGGDGQKFEHKGRTLDDRCRSRGASVEGRANGQWARVSQAEDIRYEFPDGSAIVVNGNAWDVEGSTPWSWEGAE